METPHQRILYAMSGIVLGGDYDLLSDLRQHVTEPDYFETVRKVFLTFLYNMYARAWKNKKNVPHYAERDQIFEKRSHKHNGARHGT